MEMWTTGLHHAGGRVDLVSKCVDDGKGEIVCEHVARGGGGQCQPRRKTDSELSRSHLAWPAQQ